MMRTRLVLVFAAVLLVACQAAAQREADKTNGQRAPLPKNSKVSPELWQKVHEQGPVRVIVDLNLAVEPEAKLSEQQQQLQRRAIAETQAKLLSELAGTNYEAATLLITVPAIGLRVGPDALAVLERSLLIKKVTADRTFKSDLELREQK